VNTNNRGRAGGLIKNEETHSRSSVIEVGDGV